ncbi:MULTISPECIES: carbohydrate ABC transporter permease [Desulfococcus]|uniref:ABC-type transporter, integral membrane subunit n=1 Tax=Desulfococcus multivorans DSM 2059 TaxID=1121405 RepID=S7V7E2_DESML|nr:sugar ABC transporter permease [Desulfococcus multivorans]AOY58351.1 binding protein-dependent transport system, inner membrane component [Desulfococcus multivorans]AQV00683.1 ABC transporter permease [Desulfococcus multivorans]EPR42574.1 ABC-type transporter, integral membrane subunit [Desulfococcus multivorans DSM 2059]SKA18396.1 multiple sugar transport system permease protein [Desulfococcus multivorans DSM 2059]
MRGRFRFGEQTPAALIMAGPAMLGLILFIFTPFIAALVFSFTNLRLGSPLPITFVGVKQFQRIFTDPDFNRALANTFVFASAVVPLQTALALGLALIVNLGVRGTVVFRAIFFMPVVFPMSLVSVVWILIYAPGPEGMMNAFLHLLTGGRWTARDFLRDPVLALPSIMLLSIWQGSGFQMVILLAGLQGIPKALYEAAALDGAGVWHRFRHITLPQLRNPLLFVMMITTILAFRLFDQVQIMTRGGPDNATTTVMYEMVQAVFTRRQVARASAMTVVFFVLVMGVTWVQRRLTHPKRETE